MGYLTDIVDDRIYTAKGSIKVNVAFDVVLEIQKLFRETDLSDYDKVDQALRMLVVDKWNLRLFSMREKQELLEEISRKHIAVKKRPSINMTAVPVLDFEEDGDYIYASFMQDYHMDLIDEQGRLPWKKFLFLFNGLSSESKIKQVMHIRQMEIPAFDGKNQKQIQELQKLKSYYALPVRGGGGQNGLDLLFSTLEGMARH